RSDSPPRAGVEGGQGAAGGSGYGRVRYGRRRGFAREEVRMAYRAFSDEWAEAYRNEINSSEAYRQAGKGWRWKVGLVVEAEPDKNWPEAKGLVMDLFEGEAR